jgi:hypothetical protein
MEMMWEQLRVCLYQLFREEEIKKGVVFPLACPEEIVLDKFDKS